MAFKTLKAIFSDAKDLSVINDKIDEVIADSSEETEETEETEEVAEEETEESEEETEEVNLASALEELTNQIAELKAQINEITAERDAVKEELSAKKAEEKAFISKLPKLYASLSAEKPETAPVVATFTNGIGEL